MAYLRFAVSALVGMAFAVSVYAAETRRIEEIVVTAEKRESTVSDTSISITALNQDFLEDMGIQGPDEMVNFVPAMTRNDYDLVIRGVGRNFRSLGGDPGVASYYNGVYSPDFGIAATESALYDLARVEILRGPQGTLYGRNSIGGAVNYITNDPTYHFEAELRAVSGSFDSREYYGVLSGPIIDDRLAARLVGSVRDRDGYLEDEAGGPDRGSTNDQNFALTVLFDVTDRVSLKARINDRRAASNIGAGVMFGEGPAGNRVRADDSFAIFGWREVAADFPGAQAFTHPILGTKYGARRRPGVDPTMYPYQINPRYANPDIFLYDGGDADDGNAVALSNADPSVEFDHQAVTFDMTWEINDTTTLKYTYGYQSFIYTFDKDFDFSNSVLSSYGDTVTEDVDSWSHELQLFWEWGDRITGTSGLYAFSEDRMQHYSLRNRFDQGRRINPAQYGTMGTAFGPFDVFDTMAFIPECNHFADLDVGFDTFGRWCGDVGVSGNFNTDLKNGDIGAAYEHRNDIENDAWAAYTQIDIEFTDQWSVTLGVRYAKDERYAFENRGGYSEVVPESWIYGVALWNDCCGGFTVPQMPGRLLTTADFLTPTGTIISPLAFYNVINGSATLNGTPFDGVGGGVNAENPITPVCPLTQADCGGLPIMALGGVPISWGSKAEADNDWDDINYRVNFNYEPTDDILIYFGVTTGYRAGGYSLGEPDARDNPRDVNGFPIPGPLALSDYEQEEVLAFEIGYKGLHFDGILSINMAAYYYDYENYQDDIDFFDPVRQSVVSTVGNIPKIKNLGFEIDGMWLATDHITIGGNYSYTISEYNSTFLLVNNSDPRFPGSIFGGIIGGDPFDAPPGLLETYVRDVDGEQVKGIPKHKGVFWSDVSWTTDFGNFDWYLVVAMTGEYNSHTFSRPEYDLIPERERIDTRLTWRGHDGRWQVSAFVDNVLDKSYVRSIGIGGEGNDWIAQGSPLYPRYYGVEVFMRFGQN